jgi:hypothetical protein
MPKDRDGTIAIAICLRRQDVNKLKADYKQMQFVGFEGFGENN